METRCEGGGEEVLDVFRWGVKKVWWSSEKM